MSQQLVGKSHEKMSISEEKRINCIRPRPKKKIVCYVASPSLIRACDRIPSMFMRASVVHSLIEAYGLMGKLNIVEPKLATEEDIRTFHSESYVERMKGANDEQPSKECNEEDNFGLDFDCPILDDMWALVLEIAGGTLKAAEELISGSSDIAINWCGGWHHAERDSASGFCYINDVVIAIHRLQRKFEKVLYIDLDVHHGDGVENAFAFSPKVLTFSLHRHEAGFFPGSGQEEDNGFGSGVYYTVNVPYKEGLNDSQMMYLFESVIYDIFDAFAPDAIVCQCGADTLAGDPLGGANVTLKGYLSCISNILNLNRPILLLGGGGYNKVNTAKLWTAITSKVLDLVIPEDIPEHKYFPSYGPDFIIDVSCGLIKSDNCQSFLNRLILNVLYNLLNLKPVEYNDPNSDIKKRIQMLENSLSISYA